MLLSLIIAAQAQAVTPQISLLFPLDCELGRNCVVQDYPDHDGQDYTCGGRTEPKYQGTSFRLENLGTMQEDVKVLAAAAGKVARTRDGAPDSIKEVARAVVKEDEACGNSVTLAHESGWETQYCHLQKGSVRLNQGDEVMASQPIGVVGLWAGFFHVAFPRMSAAYIGWAPSPFQFEVGMADLAIGVTACIAFWRPWEFRAAAVCVASFALLGDAVGHVHQMVASGNFAPGNAGVPFYTDIICPLLAIVLLFASRPSKA